MGMPAKEHTFIKLKTFPVVRQMGNATGQTHMTDKKPKVTAKKCVILTLHAERGNFKLPKGLIGVKTTAQPSLFTIRTCHNMRSEQSLSFWRLKKPMANLCII